MAAVDVALARAAGSRTELRAAAHALLQALLAVVTGTPGPFPLTRLCGTCGGPHGQPRLADEPLAVGVASAPGLVAAVIGHGAPVGIDVEQDARCGFPGFPGVALAAEEPDGDVAVRARAWTGKEALLKALGTGLATDPRDVVLDGSRLVRWPGPPAALGAVPAPPGWTCSVAALAPALEPTVHDGDVLLTAAPAAPSPAPMR